MQIAIPTTAYGATYYMNDRDGAVEFTKSFSSTIALTYALKYSVDRERPNGHDHSFPSGHASVAFAGATFLHKRYGFLYSLPAYLGATYVGYSRVESENHYLSDVITGALIGSLSSYYFTSKYKNYEIKPVTRKDGFGIILSKSW